MTANWRPPILHRLLLAAIAAPLVISLTGCIEVNRFLARAEGKPAKAAEGLPTAAQTAPDPVPDPQERPKPGKLYEWNGDGRRVSRIVVNTDEQKARFYDGDEQIGWATVASGVSKFPTPTGRFEVMEKVANKRSNLYGKIYGASGKVVHSDAKAGRDSIPAGARFEGASMPYFLRLTNDGIGLHAGPIPRPGRPASHGCVRMPSKLAPVLFGHVDLGTKVSIVGSGPDYGDYVQKQRALAARERERREAAARQQAIAAATSGAEPAEAAAATSPGGPQVVRVQGSASPDQVPSQAPESLALAPPEMAPSSAEPVPGSTQPEETAGSAPVASIAQAAPHRPNPSPVVPAPAGAASVPVYPLPLPPNAAVAPPYAPPLWPAAATLPAPTPVVAPTPTSPSGPGPAVVSDQTPSPPTAASEAQVTPTASPPAALAEPQPDAGHAEEG